MAAGLHGEMWSSRVTCLAMYFDPLEFAGLEVFLNHLPVIIRPDCLEVGMGMKELRALRQLLNDDRDDWDELVASYLALRKAIVTHKPLTPKDRARVAEYLHKAGWQATEVCR